MQLPSSVATIAVSVLLFADAVIGGALTTIQPCPGPAATHPRYHNITVTSQYQPVSTCKPTTLCVKGKCSTTYPLTTYSYVSTVVPHAWNGTTSQKTTVTSIDQVLRVSEYLTTSTNTITVLATGVPGWAPRLKWKKPYQNVTTTTTTVYETVTRRAVAPYSEIGPLAIPGWKGSGLCKKCSNAQLLDVIECRRGTDKSGKPVQTCDGWFETWISQPAPTSSVTATAHCSSRGNIPKPGTYTWTFPQVAPAVTITAPPRTVTVTVNGRQTITVSPSAVHTVPAKPWNAYVTKTFTVATVFEFDIHITKVIIFIVPPSRRPGM